MGKNLILHKEFGVNPTIPICSFCGEDKNEVVLLGNAYKEEAPMHMQIDNEPCDACKKKLEGNEWKFFIGDCGHQGFVKVKALQELFTEEGLKDLGDHKTFRMEKCFQCMGMV